MPRNFWLFSIRHTTIILVDSNLNMIRGDLRHIDRSTAIANRDVFNIELESGAVTEQPLPSTTSFVTSKVVIGSWSIGTDLEWLHSAPTPVPPHPSSMRHEHDIDRTSNTSGKVTNFDRPLKSGTYKSYVYARNAFRSFRHSWIATGGNGSIGT